MFAIPTDQGAHGELLEFERSVWPLDYAISRQIEVLFDGTLFLRGQPLQAFTSDDIDAVLGIDAPSVPDLLDEVFLLAKSHDVGLKKSELSAALGQVLRSQNNRGHQVVMGPLLKDCSPHELEQAKEEWKRV